MIEDDLNGVRMGDFLVQNNFINQRGHVDGRVVQQGLNHFVHLRRFEYRLIALNVDDNRVGGKIKRLDRFGDAVSSGTVRSCCHHDVAAEMFYRIEYPLVVGGYRHIGNGFGFGHAFIDVLNHRLAA